MNLKQCFLTKNECYQRGKTMIPKGIMVHSTGANNPNLKRYVGPDDGFLGTNSAGNHWNRYRPDGRQVCVHAFIGKLKDGTIASYQTLPWNFVGWHSGKGVKGSANNMGYIGFEICEDGLTDGAYFAKVYKEAVELTAHLCKTYKLDPMKDGVVICHSEGHTRGIASNHGDVMHWFPKHGKNMNTFRNDVKAAMGGTSSETKPTTKTPYLVRVTDPSLNIRKGPGTNYDINGQIRDKGVYTIVDESAGPGATKWGKLKSGIGWISLDFTKKV